MERNRIDPSARQWQYIEFPQHYTWQNKNKETRHWAPQKRQFAIGRIYSAHQFEGERYYLRLLLIHLRGIESWEAFRTVNGIVHHTFRAAAIALGLLEDSRDLELALDEAKELRSPYSLRCLFALILAFCHPSDERRLWDKYVESMGKDFQYYGITGEDLINHILWDVRDILLQHNRSLSEFSLPEMTSTGAAVNEARIIHQERSIVSDPSDLEAINHLNEAQKAAYDVIMDCVLNKKPGVFFIDGPGGSGKTYLYR